MTGCTFDHLHLLSAAQSPPSCISCYRATLLFCSLLSHLRNFAIINISTISCGNRTNKTVIIPTFLYLCAAHFSLRPPYHICQQLPLNRKVRCRLSVFSVKLYYYSRSSKYILKPLYMCYHIYLRHEICRLPK